MKNILSLEEINQFKADGAIVLRNKFDIHWIEKLKRGIAKDIKSPSPRFKSHTTKNDIPAYLEDYWTWDLVPEFKNFVFNSPTAKIAAELLNAKKMIKGNKKNLGLIRVNSKSIFKDFNTQRDFLFN